MGGVILDFKERNSKVIKLLSEVYQKFAEYNIEKIFVSENLGILLACDGDIHLFTSGDVDNCAHPSEAEKVLKVMNDLGFSVKKIYSGKRLVTLKCYVPEKYKLPNDFYFGVDFQVSARTELPCYVEQSQLLSWNLKTYKDTHIKIPTNEELAYICMLHTSAHRFIQPPGVRLYYDLICASKLDVNFSVIDSWTRQHKTRKRVSIGLSLSNKIVNTKWPLLLDNNETAIVKKSLYDSKNKILKGSLNKIELLLIESNSFDTGIISGLFKILCPSKDWLKCTYNKNVFIAELMHLKHLL